MNSNLSHFVRIPHQSFENTISWRCHRWYNFQIQISTSSMFPTMVDPEDADPSRAWADSQWQPKELSFELANQQVHTNKVPKQKPQLFPTARKRGCFMSVCHWAWNHPVMNFFEGSSCGMVEPLEKYLELPSLSHIVHLFSTCHKSTNSETEFTAFTPSNCNDTNVQHPWRSSKPICLPQHLESFGIH